MAKIIMAPNKYVQARGELLNLAKYVTSLGQRALCLITDMGLHQIKSNIENSFVDTSCTLKFMNFMGECCKEEIDRIILQCKENDVDVIIGIGGGKIHDTAKAVGYYHNIPVVIVPTIASTDAPCSAQAVLYKKDGQFERYLHLKKNPDLVLVDTDVIANAPTRLLVSGMGDALSTYFEARACERSHAITLAGGTATLAGMSLAKLCYETLIENGVQAKDAVDHNTCTIDVEKVIEANILLSGIGFECGGLAAAHSIHNGFTVLKQSHCSYHGEKVAFGTLVQLVLEDATTNELNEVLEFCKKVGLPITLDQLGLEDWKREDIIAIAKLATKEGETIHNMPFTVSAEDVYAAILAADTIGRDYMDKDK